VVPLTPAAVERERPPAVARAQGEQAPGDLGERLVPPHAREAPVGLAPQRVLQPVGVLLIVLEARGLLAQVALRDRVGLVAADAHDPRAVGLDAQAAVT
jgi:hypothetical protein